MSIIIAAALAASGLCIDHVHDGDTLTLCNRQRVRLQDIDAPEVAGSPRCSPQSLQRLQFSKNPPWCDYRLGEQSAAELRRFLSTGRVSIERTGQDQYGRTLARIYVGDQDAGEHLIGLGLARRWR